MLGMALHIQQLLGYKASFSWSFLRPYVRYALPPNPTLLQQTPTPPPTNPYSPFQYPAACPPTNITLLPTPTALPSIPDALCQQHPSTRCTLTPSLHHLKTFHPGINTSFTKSDQVSASARDFKQVSACLSKCPV